MPLTHQFIHKKYRLFKSSTNLISMLNGPAYKAIEGMAITNINYKGAIDILKLRFGNISKSKIKHALYADLRSI